MSQSGSTEWWMDALDLSNMGVALLLVVFAGVTGTYVWRLKRLEFNAIWHTRLALVFAAACWAASIGIQAGSDGPRSLDGLEGQCPAYLIIKYVVFEPAFFLIILHIVKYTTRTAQDSAGQTSGILVSSLLWWLLYASVQTAIALFGLFGPLDQEINDSWLFAQGTTEHGACHLAVAGVAVNAVFMIAFVISYMSWVTLVLRMALNARLLQVLSRLHWCGAVLLPGTIACRVSFLVLDQGYAGEFDRALRAVVGIEALLNTCSAALGLWVFVWRPVKAAAIYPLRRTQWNAGTATGAETSTNSPVVAAAAPDSYMELKVKSLVDSSLDALPEHTELGFTAESPEPPGRPSRGRSVKGTGTEKKKKKKKEAAAPGEEGVEKASRKKKDEGMSAGVTKRSKRRRRRRGSEEAAEGEAKGEAPEESALLEAQEEKPEMAVELNQI